MTAHKLNFFETLCNNSPTLVIALAVGVLILILGMVFVSKTASLFYNREERFLVSEDSFIVLVEEAAQLYVFDQMEQDLTQTEIYEDDGSFTRQARIYLEKKARDFVKECGLHYAGFEKYLKKTDQDLIGSKLSESQYMTILTEYIDDTLKTIFPS